MSVQKIIVISILFLLCAGGNCQEVPYHFDNPVLSGYHPDPSICRVGEDYYMVTSTFVWFPGIPVYHSKDLVNWELIGHGINRPDQLAFDGLADRSGVFAVTIRHHDGLFYLITTCVECKGNFYITATKPEGPWSDPIWIEDSPGIDPSLMWDDDGKCYYTGMTWINEQHWPTQCGIWTQELDLEKKKLVGERKIFTYGHANNASYTEGPHLYKINDKYLLLLSEGGTGLYHGLSVHHSDSLFGNYVADMINPVMTHRHLGNKYPIQATGHGDLVQTQNGEWWCVLLGKRLMGNEMTFTRETFLAKVDFEGQTPIFNQGHGKVLTTQQRPDLPWSPFPPKPAIDGFEKSEIDLKWCTIRTPKSDFYNLKNGRLNLQLKPEVAQEKVHSSILVQRIKQQHFEAATKMNFDTKKENEQAGLMLYRTTENHYLLLKEKSQIVLVKVFNGKKEIIAKRPYNKSAVFFKATADNLEVQFSYGEALDKMTPIGDTQSMVVLADGNGNMFHGPGIGMYATSNGMASKNTASFDWFIYDDQ